MLPVPFPAQRRAFINCARTGDSVGGDRRLPFTVDVMTPVNAIPVISAAIEEPWQLSEVRAQLGRIRDDLTDLHATLQGLIAQTTWETRSRAINAFQSRLRDHAEHTAGALTIIDDEITRFGAW
ncbi:hypothetical protein GCM10017596_06860 [Microbacterium keratanolyticum]|uniref:Uncharacterized protein n=2 Tax=Microbacterium keratanolyticum TaxID=67574 RepID=A0A9W6HQD0_9MICO|nr:hypothetical protein GCM10017596_06860 [Microbacterium keratanolyticum]